MEYDKYQNKVFDTLKNGKGNVIIKAVAGSGKTTTIKHCITLIPKGSDSIYIAFNNGIVKEMKEAMPKAKTKISTMHSFCWGMLMRSTKGKAKLNKGKSYKYIEKTLKKYKVKEDREAYYFYMLSNMIDLIRHNLASDLSEIKRIGDRFDFTLGDEELKMISEVLILMDKDKKEYDFTDMIYRVIKDDVKLPKYDYIFIDESQDLSIIQQEVLKRIRKPKGRMFAVGDPNQAIYGFAGSDSNSYKNLKNLFLNTTELPLSFNYRCGRNIITEAQNINPEIQAWSGAKSGIVREGGVMEVKNGDWVLCRNVKPLVMMNLFLLDKGVKSFIKGFDIGIGLTQLIKRTKKTTTKSILEEHQKQIFQEIVKLKRKGVRNPRNTEKIDNMNQKHEILKILFKEIKTSTQAIDKIKSIFKESGTGVVLSTIHKAKGQENDRIFLLLPNLIPNQYAVQPWQIEQEMNLMYVAITRAKNALIYIPETEFKIVKETLEE